MITPNTSGSPRDAVYRSLAGEEPEQCPYYIWVDDRMVPLLAERYGLDQFLGDDGATRTFAGSYTFMTEITALPVEDQGDCFVDEYGVKYRRGSALHVEQPALPGPSLAGYSFPDLTTDEHFAHLEDWLHRHEQRFRIVQLGMLLFERTWGMRGMENILTDFCLEPAFAEDLLDGLEAVCAGVVDRLLRDHGERIDAIGLSDDCGCERSMLISPDTWRTFIRPRLARLCDRIHAGGKLAYLHSCGHVTPIIGDLIEIGVDMLQPLQPEAMNIFALKQDFGEDICLMGGVSTQQTLPFGMPDDVRREIRTCLDRMARGGRYVMAPAKPILPGVPLENAMALIDAFVDQNA